jgi:type I restriction enzyme M protein
MSGAQEGGEFFTPTSIVKLIVEIIEPYEGKIYDPACGSGSLLLKFAKILGKENVHQGFYGQEINITTYNLCRINMFLHDIDFDNFNIGHGDTLDDPMHWDDEPFEAIVSNPPYSINWDGDANPLLINDPRFSPAGVLAPKSKADLAFIMHSLSWLATNGTAAIVCFPGVMYRGGAEQKIRKYLIDNNYIDCIIQLPNNLFFGTSIATCIMVLKKSKSENKTLFIDATRECKKVTNSNKLEDDNIARIVSAFESRKNEDYFTYLADKEEIEQQDYNLSVSSYVEQEDTREVIDITVLNAKIEEIVARESILRDEIAKIIADIEVGQ